MRLPSSGFGLSIGSMAHSGGRPSKVGGSGVQVRSTTAEQPLQQTASALSVSRSSLSLNAAALLSFNFRRSGHGLLEARYVPSRHYRGCPLLAPLSVAVALRSFGAGRTSK